MRVSIPAIPVVCVAPLAILAAVLTAGTPSEPGPAPTGSERSRPEVDWRDSVAVGVPEAGSLVRGVRFPATGEGHFTWDPVRRERPSRGWRRWGTDDLVRTALGVVRRFHRDHPAIRVGIGDLSRPRGGDFGPRFGFIGHATHQNGLDVDVYYPRLDQRERPPERVDQVDVSLSQDLLDRFVAAGADLIYVGPSTPLTGPPEIVEALANHDNHMHVRIPNPG